MATAAEVWDVIDQGDDPLRLPLDRFLTRVVGVMRSLLPGRAFRKWLEQVHLPESGDQPGTGPWSEEAMAQVFKAGAGKRI